MDWKKHIEEFNRLNEQGAMTIAEYAAAHGLNPNTARRYLRSSGVSQSNKKGDHGAGDHDQSKAAKTAGKPAKKGHDHASDQTGVRSKQSASKKKPNKTIDNAGTRQRTSDAQERADISPVIKQARDTLKVTPAPVYMSRPDLIVPGAYDGPDDEDFQAAREILARNGVDRLEGLVIEKTFTQLLLLERARSQGIRYLEKVRQEQEEQQPADDDEDGGRRVETPAIKQLLTMLANSTACITELTKTLAHMRLAYRKDTRDQQKHDLKYNEPQVIRQAYEEKRKNDWSAVETAEFIEMHGVRIPPFLLEQARAEMKAPPQVVDEEGEHSDEELDRQAREGALERRAKHNDWLIERNLEVAAIVDRGGFGDVGAGGQLNDFDLDDDFDDDEEEDEELTRSLYGREGEN